MCDEIPMEVQKCPRIMGLNQVPVNIVLGIS
jgi:hypothetical protein